MTRRLVLSPAAEGDFHTILGYIARDKPGAAKDFVSKLRARCALLVSHPLVGEDCSALRPKMRRIAYAGYVMFFRVDEDVVEIVRVIHGSRDWEHEFE